MVKLNTSMKKVKQQSLNEIRSKEYIEERDMTVHEIKKFMKEEIYATECAKLQGFDVQTDLDLLHYLWDKFFKEENEGKI